MVKTSEILKAREEAEEKPFLQLTGEDGNAFYILGRARRVLRRETDWSREEIEAFQNEATSGGYNNVLNTCMKYFDCA